MNGRNGQAFAKANQVSLDPGGILDRRTLILGEVNTGKTTLCGRMLEALVRETGPDRICVVDLAPVIPVHLARKIGRSNIGGRMRLPDRQGLLYLPGEIEPPRLISETEAQALAAAHRNLVEIGRIFEIFTLSKRDILFVNDISLHLQAGGLAALTAWLALAGTVVANGYYGRSLGLGRISIRERRGMEVLSEFFDRVIHL